jgi:CRISPR-associated protein Csd1
MILQALKEYYERKATEGSIAKKGWVKGGIDFLILLDEEGNYQAVNDLRDSEGKKKISHSLDVPNIGKQSLKHSNSGKDANLLWDNASFVLGLGDKGDLRLKSMIQAIDNWLGNAKDTRIFAVRKFLEMGLKNRSTFSPLLMHQEYGELFKEGSVKITFCVGTKQHVVFEIDEVAIALSKDCDNNIEENEKTVFGTCLVTGVTNTSVEMTHPVTKGVWGAQSSGACIVSFNKDAFNSYNKKQSVNAPVGKIVATQYGKALNALLDSENQCLHIGDASTVFWSERKTDFESDFTSFFSEPPKDDPDAGVKKIRALYDSVNSGAFIGEENTNRFYVLGLAPNAARIAVRFWQTGTVKEFAEKIKCHFDDLEIVKPPKEPEFYSLWRLLVNIATQDKSENIPPNVAGDFMRAILTGAPYPATLLQAALRRIRSDTENRVKPVRAALIKAYLNRYHRLYKTPNNKELLMSLDTSQPSIGYQLGRLFAALEKIQEEANPGINATIRERFYGAACASPVTVFANLMRLKNHHLAKMGSKGRVVNFERLLAEIIGRFIKSGDGLYDFPANLDLHEQGRFAIGYYHQRQDLFTKKDDANTTK